MATIDEFVAKGDFQLGALDAKTRIAPVTQNGKPVFITLCATPDLQTPWSVWPSYDGGARCSVELLVTPQLQKLGDHIDKVVLETVKANPSQWFSKTPKSVEDLHNSVIRQPSKEQYQPTFRCKCSLREKSASFKAWDLERKTTLGVDDLKQLDWPNSRMAICAQLSGVYFQASGFGAVIQLKSVGLRTASAVCPFEFVEV